MVVTMMIARNRRIMGQLAIGPWLEFGGWISTLVMWLVAGFFLLS